MQTDLGIAVVGAGPVGLALALLAAATCPRARITLHDARAAEHDVGGDARTIALAAGSVQLLKRLDAWPAAAAEPITEVHVSQVPPGWLAARGEVAVHLRAADLGVAALGAVLPYGPLVDALQRRWLAAVQAAPERLAARFGAAVTAVDRTSDGVAVEAAGETARYDLAVIAEGGVYAAQARKPIGSGYAQTAWVGTATLAAAPRGLAVERFTRDGPLALLPLRSAGGEPRAAVVWCVASSDDTVAALDETQRIAVLNTLLPAAAGRIVGLGPLKPFALGLNAERTLVDARGRIVRIGNAAQTLHPVAGQGLNLGLRDAYELVAALRAANDVDAALRRAEWARAPDRWSVIATTDFLARSFTWRWPGAAAARGLALAALEELAPLKRALARQMMYGMR